MRRAVTFNLLVFALLLLAVEAAGQIYYRWTEGAFLPQLYRRQVRDAQALGEVFEPHPYLVGRPKRGVTVARGQSTISTTPIHTRATARTPPKPGAVRVALVGGSTTFGTRVTDADSWPWLLQERLGDGYEVINYGVPGYTTAEALIQMTLLVPEAKPAIVVFCQGWNDLRNYHWAGSGPDYYAHGMTQFDTLIPRVEDRTTLWARAAGTFFVLSLVDGALGTPVGAQAGQPALLEAPDPEVDRIFRRNLATLKALTRRLGASSIFVPQVLNEESYARPSRSRSWTPFIARAAVPRLMARFNGFVSEVCAAGEPDCQFAGEVLAERWNGNDFVDEGHFSRRGGEKFAAILARRIR